MKINRDDPWYPNPYKEDEYCPHHVFGGCPKCRGVTIRLKLAAEMMKSPHLETIRQTPRGSEPRMSLVDVASLLADAMIERADRDEGKAG